MDTDDTASRAALLLHILEMNFLYWLQTAQVSWPGLIECQADDKQTLFRPFSLVGCQE